MRRAVALVMAAVAAAGLSVVAPVTASTVAAPAQVTVVNAYSFDTGENLPLSVCLYGILIAQNLSTEASVGPVTLPSGDVNADVTLGSISDCNSEPDFSVPVTIPAGGNVTLMVYWSLQNQSVAVLPNDTSCLDPGTARLTLRHGAGVRTQSEDENVDLWATPPGGTFTKLVSDLAPGDQATTDQPAGTYTDGVVDQAGNTVADPVLTLGNLDLVAGQELVVYLYGGVDGSVGSFTQVNQLTTCQQPTTTSTTAAPTTTTAPPAAAKAVTATPAFTG